ncbi:hypothetical protein KEM56_003079 [Ascosphaera pollenicola]|nr:hypothetical protein KEM56_003079 [Ascosphaera pollenicola]
MAGDILETGEDQLVFVQGIFSCGKYTWLWTRPLAGCGKQPLLDLDILSLGRPKFDMIELSKIKSAPEWTIPVSCKRNNLTMAGQGSQCEWLRVTWDIMSGPDWVLSDGAT